MSCVFYMLKKHRHLKILEQCHVERPLCQWKLWVIMIRSTQESKPSPAWSKCGAWLKEPERFLAETMSWCSTSASPWYLQSWSFWEQINSAQPEREFKVTSLKPKAKNVHHFQQPKMLTSEKQPWNWSLCGFSNSKDNLGNGFQHTLPLM